MRGTGRAHRTENDPGLRSDRGTDSVPYYSNRRSLSPKELDGGTQTVRKDLGREERQY